MNKLIGILGGIGSLAGLRLVDHAIRYAINRGAKQDSDFPKLLYYNLPVSGMSECGIEDFKEVFRQIRIAVSQMEAFGCHHIIVACNSIYSFYPKLQGMSAIHIANIVEQGCRLAIQHGSNVGVLCSDSARRDKLFDQQLQRLNATPIHVDESDQVTLNAIIGRAINASNNPDDRLLLGRMSTSLKAKGATCVMLGCTELGLVFDPALTTLKTVDCGTVAVEEALG